MESLINIPDFQPLPMPAPSWLLQSLLVVGLFTHVVPMNVVWVGGLIAGLLLIFNKKHSSYANRLARDLAFSLPFFLSFAITQGIVPLLFLQLVYGPLYYSSSILIAVPWISVLLILLTGYYALYIFKFKEKQLAGFGPYLLISTTVLFTLIGYIFTHNMTLMLNPAEWAGLAEKSSFGLNLHFADPQILPRFLHFFIGAFAVSGLIIGAFGLYDYKDKAYGSWLIKKGSLLFVVSTFVEILSGAWFLMALPRETMMNFMGQDIYGTGAFGLSMVLVLVAILASLFAMQKGNKIAFIISLTSALLGVLFMIMMRHFLRVYMTQSFIDPSAVPVQMQWDLFIAFLILAVGLIIYLAWLIKVSFSAAKGVKG